MKSDESYFDEEKRYGGIGENEKIYYIVAWHQYKR